MGYARTKIIATVGPSTDSDSKIKDLIRAGVNVFRMNFSHGSQEEHLRVIQRIQKVREELQQPVAIMMDTKGFEIRVEPLPQKAIQIEEGRSYRVGDHGDFTIRPHQVLAEITVGMELLFDDGYLVGECKGTYDGGVVVEFKNGRLLKENKNVHIPSARLSIPDLSDQDASDILFACSHGVELVAVSFVTSKKNIEAIEKLLKEAGLEDVGLIAKIETTKAIENFEEILQKADGIMVARGDLGIELPMEELPSIQKKLIAKAAKAGKFTIVATQMLESMIENPRPTRAEVSDVANAIFESTSAVMLSGETAMGKYPIETVKQMRRIILDAERHCSYTEAYLKCGKNNHLDTDLAIAHGVVSLSMSCKTVAIIVFSKNGRTACSISSLRPEHKVYLVTGSKRTYHRLAIQWNVIPILADYQDLQSGLERVTFIGSSQNWLKPNDLLVVTYGDPIESADSANIIQLYRL
ncbi:MAG: pyruvate kinase [Chlamydiia bacterium]